MGITKKTLMKLNIMMSKTPSVCVRLLGLTSLACARCDATSSSSSFLNRFGLNQSLSSLLFEVRDSVSVSKLTED